VAEVVAGSATHGAGDLKAELEQLAVDPGRAPARVLAIHSSNQRTDFSPQTRAANCSAGTPSPEKPKACAMPRNDRLRLHHDKKIGPVRVNSPQESPEEAIQGCQSRTRLLPFINHQLLPQSSAFQREPMSG
jgi:hypothetical protein